MMLPGDQPLSGLLGPVLTADLEREARTINPDVTLDVMNRLQPWAAAALLLELEDQRKYPDASALDTILFERGTAAGKETGGIETLDEQLAVFDKFSTAEQVAMVKDTIRQLRAFRAQRRSPSDYFAQLYLAGDLDQLVTELNKLDASGDDPKLTAKFMDLLLYRRNATMAARIIQRLREHPDTSCFFAIGAAHLQGDKGLLASLKKAGFRLTRVQ
jgi:uncharacterized protein YbaP (TraB family)